MNTYIKQYVRNCILNRKVIPSIIRKEIYIKLLELIESKEETFICIALESYICRSYSISNDTLSRIFDYINDDYKYAEILPEFNRNNIKKYANLFSNTYDTLNYSWFTINKQGIEDRITFIKLMINLVNKKIEQENNIKHCKIMANRHYDENGVVRMLSKNPFVTVDTVNKSITYSESTGIHTFGKIDYLVNYHQYHARKGNATRVAPTNSEYTINKKLAKRDNKNSFVNSIKSIFKKQ